MKKIIFVLFAIIALVACQSNEQKVEALVKEEVKKQLFHPETYEPIEMKVDSAFAPYDDVRLYKVLEKLGNASNEIEEQKSILKRAETAMAMWGSSYVPEFGKINYQQAKEDRDEANAKMENLQKKIEKYVAQVESIIKEGRKFVGFKAIHSYRAKNNAGNTVIGNLVLFIDKDIKEVVYGMELEGYKQIQTGIEDWKTPE